MSPSAKPPIFTALDRAREALNEAVREIAVARKNGEEIDPEKFVEIEALKATVEEIRAQLPRWKELSKRPPIDDCTPRRLYRVRARSLGPMAVYAGKGAFIGLQLNWGSVCMFTEYHWDTGSPYGTVFEAEDTGIDMPDEIPLSASPGTIDEHTGRWVDFDSSERKWFFTDTGEMSEDIKPVGKSNDALYDWLWEQGAVAKHWDIKN